ncbi:hypothetical protein [Streptomyces sp. NBC_00454]|uniref:hypothetical protein n=1 Tax=Streptomyces sp. NBC_00454 TaxID=2975747 RepID=UPI0030E25775
MEKAEPAAESTNVVDLAEALRASVERAKGSKGSRGTPAKHAKQAKHVKKRTGGLPEAEQLEGLTKAELYEKAAAAGIPGRSNMARDELREALTSPGTRSPRAA